MSSLPESVIRISFSPKTESGDIFVLKILEATVATARFLSSVVPIDVIVAEVPIHIRLSAFNLRLIRLTSIATSAPCLPRYV